VVMILFINAVIFLCCIGRDNIITTMRFENPVHGVAHGDVTENPAVGTESSLWTDMCTHST